MSAAITSVHSLAVVSCLVEESSGHCVSQQAAALPKLLVRRLDDVMVGHCQFHIVSCLGVKKETAEA